jgi:hypothetical protein
MLTAGRGGSAALRGVRRSLEHRKIGGNAKGLQPEKPKGFPRLPHRGLERGYRGFEL